MVLGLKERIQFFRSGRGWGVFSSGPTFTPQLLDVNTELDSVLYLFPCVIV